MAKTSELTAEDRLGRLASLRNQLQALGYTRDLAVKKIMAPVQAKVDKANGEFEAAAAEIQRKAAAVEARIKAEVVERAETVRGDGLMAVYVRPKVSWNSERLEGLRAAFPAIDTARTEAEEGTVQIRKS